MWKKRGALIMMVLTLYFRNCHDCCKIKERNIIFAATYTADSPSLKRNIDHFISQITFTDCIYFTEKWHILTIRVNVFKWWDNYVFKMSVLFLLLFGYCISLGGDIFLLSLFFFACRWKLFSVNSVWLNFSLLVLISWILPLG